MKILKLLKAGLPSCPFHRIGDASRESPGKTKERMERRHSKTGVKLFKKGEWILPPIPPSIQQGASILLRCL
jgi:hypothetical protein